MTDTQTSLNLVRSSVAFLLMAACQNTQPLGYCTAAYSPAVIITAEDSGTHANLAVGASGLARSGAYVDSLRRVDSVLWGGARIGNYQLTVERLGYHQWTRTGVQVTQVTECGMPVSVHVTALLQPSP